MGKEEMCLPFTSRLLPAVFFCYFFCDFRFKMAVYNKVAFLVTSSWFCLYGVFVIGTNYVFLWQTMLYGVLGCFLCNNEGKSMWEVFYRCKVLIFMKNEVFYIILRAIYHFVTTHVVTAHLPLHPQLITQPLPSFKETTLLD